MNTNRNRHSLWSHVKVATPTECAQRRGALRRAGHTMADVARLARVSFRFVQYWYTGDRRSARIAAAHRRLTEGPR